MLSLITFLLDPFSNGIVIPLEYSVEDAGAAYPLEAHQEASQAQAQEGHQLADHQVQSQDYP